jgi:hypothetical protein
MRKHSVAMGICGIVLIFGMTFVGCDTESSYSSGGDYYTPIPNTTTYEYDFSNYSSHSVSVYVYGYGSFTLGTSSNWVETFELSNSSIAFTFSPMDSVRYEQNGRNYSFFDKSTGGNDGTGGSTTIPSAPTITSATAASSSAVSVTWSSVSGATSYLVYYGTGSSLTTYVTAYSSPATITGLSANTTYKFIVKAENSAGWSADSNVVTAKTLAASGSSGTGSVKVVNASIYSDDPIFVELYRQNDSILLGSTIIYDDSNHTFTNVPSGILLRVSAIDDYDTIYWCTVFTLTSGQTKIITYNGNSLSP